MHRSHSRAGTRVPRRRGIRNSPTSTTTATRTCSYRRETSRTSPNTHTGIQATCSWVEVKAGDRVQRRELTVGGGHAGGQLGWIHFGIGTAETAQVRVQWPDGTMSAWMDVPTKRYATIDRGEGNVTPWQPSP